VRDTFTIRIFAAGDEKGGIRLMGRFDLSGGDIRQTGSRTADYEQLVRSFS
jgi:hypothetical protein